VRPEQTFGEAILSGLMHLSVGIAIGIGIGLALGACLFVFFAGFG
jgi:hypothetical protein